MPSSVSTVRHSNDYQLKLISSLLGPSVRVKVGLGAVDHHNDFRAGAQDSLKGAVGEVEAPRENSMQSYLTISSPFNLSNCFFFFYLLILDENLKYVIATRTAKRQCGADAHCS